MSSQGAAHPHVGVLTSPPFYTIPGISPSSPISTQIEQIDQLNTLLLQSIDANFARVNQIITARILPEVKRFALASEPTRKSADFWHHFYTSAAGTNRVVRAGEESEMTMSTLSSVEPAYQDRTMSVEGSFMSAFDPPQGVSSTPLRRDRDVSWEGSDLDSPYERLDRKLNETDSSMSGSVPKGYSPTGGQYDFNASTGTVETPDLPQYLKPREKAVSPTTAFKSYAPSDTSHASVTEAFKNYDAREDSVTRAFKSYAPSDSSHASTASAFKQYAPEETSATTAFRNFVPSESFDSISRPRSLEPSRASSTTLARSTASRFDEDDVDTPKGSRPRPSHHLIDLNNTPPSNATTHRSEASRPLPRMRDLLEDSEDDMARLNLSPPRTLAFTLPPRANAIYNEANAKTPGRDSQDEATRELGNLLADITAHLSPSPSPMRQLPAEFRRYSVLPSELGPGRKLFDTSAANTSKDTPKDSSRNIFAPSPPDNIFAPPFDPETYAGPSRPRRSIANTSFGSDIQTTEDGPVIEDDDDSGDDSFDDDTVLMQAAQTAAAAGFDFDDDSFVSDDNSFNRFTETHVVGQRDDASEVFGGEGGGRFALHQKEDMSTYWGGKLEDAEIPHTPLGRGDGDISRLGRR